MQEEVPSLSLLGNVSTDFVSVLTVEPAAGNSHCNSDACEDEQGQAGESHARRLHADIPLRVELRYRILALLKIQAVSSPCQDRSWLWRPRREWSGSHSSCRSSLPEGSVNH